MNYEQYNRLRILKDTFEELSLGSLCDYYNESDNPDYDTYERLINLYAKRQESAQMKLDNECRQTLLQELFERKTAESKRELARGMAQLTGIPRQVGLGFNAKVNIEYLNRVALATSVIENGCDKLPDEETCTICAGFIAPLCVKLNAIIG